MPKGMQYALLGAILGFATSKTKKARTTKAVTWGIAAALISTQVAPRVGLNLPSLTG